jgi:hypothetical protein
MSYGLKLAGAAALLLLAGGIAILLFNALWFRIGFGTAILVVVGGMLLFAWRQDKKAKESRAGLERI